MSPDLHLGPHERAARRVGATVLKWRLDALLGVGGTAAVYAATHHNRSRVALKILHRELCASPEMRARFLREAYVANSVGHEGAVQIIDDHASEQGEIVLLMPLLEGRSLDALLAARGVLPVDEALGYADQILDVLAAAHARGIVHRDIKPQNVFITTAGQAKVLDFGVARIFDGSASMTATGSLVGTPAFMPPEQAGGRVAEIGPASDLWSLGATVFNLLTGRFVHEAENVQQHTVRAAVHPARSLATLRPDLPAPVVEWVDTALAFEIHKRFASAPQMREALARVRAKLAPPRFSDPGRLPPAPPPRFSDPGLLPPPPPPRHSDPALLPTMPQPPRFSDPGPAPSGPVSGGAPPPRASAPGASAHQGAAPAPDAAAIARAHGLPPPAPKREITRGEKLGLAAVAVLFVVVVAFVVRGLASRGPEAGATNGTGSAQPAATDLSVWLGSSTGGDPGAAEAPSTAAEPAATSGLVAEEARAALEAAEIEARRCSKKPGPRGRVSVQVTFYPDGDTTAQVEIAFGRTPVGMCVEEAFRTKARVKPFEGKAVTVTRMVHVGG